MTSYLETTIKRIEASPEFMTSVQVARVLGVPKETFHRRRQRGKGPAYERLPGGQILYTRENVVAWLKSGTLCQPRPGRTAIARAPFQMPASLAVDDAAAHPASQPR